MSIHQPNMDAGGVRWLDFAPVSASRAASGEQGGTCEQNAGVGQEPPAGDAGTRDHRQTQFDSPGIGFCFHRDWRGNRRITCREGIPQDEQSGSFVDLTRWRQESKTAGVATSPLAKFSQVALNPRRLASKAMQNARWLAALTQGLEADKARVKYGCAKALRIVSEERPGLLYPQFDFFVRLLDHPNKIFQWEAAFVLSHLAHVDTDDRFRAIFKKYFSPVSGLVMITAANVIRGSAEIARANPQLADRIAAEVLKVARGRFQTPECRNIAVGHAITALGKFSDLLQQPKPVLQFVRRQLKNSRPATRKKATRFLRLP
jgi:hypothetical protein